MDHVALTALCGEATLRWWRDPATGKAAQRYVGEALMLVVSELAEAMEGHRKSLMDTHLPQYPMLHVELADAAIRLYDLLYHTGMAPARAFSYAGGPVTGPSLRALATEKTMGGKLLVIVGVVIGARRASSKDEKESKAGYWSADDYPKYLAACILLIEGLAAELHADLNEIIQAKLAYNATREDHSDAARLASNGKKY